MRIRIIATVFLSFVTAITSACLELSTTNDPGGSSTGGAGNVASSGTTGGMGTAGNDGVGGTSSSSSSSSSAGGMTKCDDPNPTCSTCEVCEGQTMGGACANQYAACRNNSNCALVDDCIHECSGGDATCLNACWSKLNSMGDGPYNDYYVCMYCGTCLNSCSQTIPCD